MIELLDELMEKNKSKICIKCNSEKSFKWYWLCKDCKLYFYGKGKFPHQKIRRTKKWKENRENLLIKANYKCEWCGKEKEGKDLTIHHDTQADLISSYSKYETTWNEIVETEFLFIFLIGT